MSAAITTDAVREVFMIAGDDSHKRLQGDVARVVAAAVGLASGLPPGRPGNPNSDCEWYPTDWMDTTRSQQVLSFQRHSFSDLLAEMRAKSGWRRYPLRVTAPVARGFPPPIALLPGARSLRRPVGRHPGQVGQPRAGRFGAVTGRFHGGQAIITTVISLPGSPNNANCAPKARSWTMTTSSPTS